MNIKKMVLVVSTLYVAFFISIFLVDKMCDSAWCRIHDDDPLGWIFFIFLPLLATFFFSLLTYRMKGEVFRAWWSFARWWVPVIIIVTLWIENAGGGGGWGMNGGAFDAIFIGIFYFIFVVISIVKIVRTYLSTK